MATKIPPHNLSELIDAITFTIDKAVLATADAKSSKGGLPSGQKSSVPKLKRTSQDLAIKQQPKNF